MSTISDLQYIFDNVHNESSTVTMPSEFEYDSDITSDTWFDKIVLRWF